MARFGLRQAPTSSAAADGDDDDDDDDKQDGGGCNGINGAREAAEDEIEVDDDMAVGTKSAEW